MYRVQNCCKALDAKLRKLYSLPNDSDFEDRTIFKSYFNLI